MAERNGNRSRGSVMDAPKEQLGEEFQHLMSALTGRVLSGANDRVSGLTDKLSGIAEGGGGGVKALAKGGEKVAEGKSPVSAGLSAAGESIKSKVGNLFGGGGKGGKGKGKDTKVTNIVEQIDIGAPVRVVYNQWTQFQDFSGFMKKVESVDQKEEQKLTFKAQVLWSHREWESTIVEQVPDKRIVWRSKGHKGRVDGAVTFHEIGPELTRVLLVLEYHPQGLFERTGNIWRAQGRRVRLELKHFRRHVMTRAMLHPDEVEGWRGEIHDGEVARSDEDVRRDEENEAEDQHDDSDDTGDEDDNRAEDEYDEDEDEEDEDEAGDDEDEYEDDGAQDEYEDEDEDAEEEDDEYEDEGDEDEDAEDEYDDEDEGAEHEYDDESDEDDEEEEEDERPRQRSRRRQPASAGRRRSR